MDLLDLFVKLSIDDSDFDKGLDSVKSKISTLKSVAAGVGAAVAAVTGTVAAVEAVGKAVVQGTSELAQYGDHIDKMSQKMGMSAEAFQEWDAVMQHSGTSMETLKASMKTLASAAQTGSDAFDKLGISQEQIASMSQEELFSATITALQNVEDETERTYLAGKTLGRGATELGALLNTSAEETQRMKDRVHELGGVLSDEAVKASAQFQDNLQDMNTAIDGIKRSVEAEFLPALNLLMEGFTSLIASEDGAEEKLTQGFDKLLDGFEGAIQKLEPIAKELIPRLVDFIIQSFPRLAELSVDIVDTLVNAILENLPNITTAAIEVVTTLINGISNMLPELIPAAVEAVIQIAEAIIDNLDAMVDASIELVTALADGIIQSLPILLEKAPEIIIKLGAALVRNLEKLRDFPQKIFEAIADGLVHIDWRETADKMMQNLIGALDEAIKQVQVWIDDAMSYLTGAESVYGGDIANVPTSEFINNMNAGKDEVVNAVGDFAEAVQGAYDAYYGVAEKNNAKVVEYSAEAMGKMADAQAQSAKNAGRTTQEAIAEILGRRNQTTGAIVDSVAKTVDITKEQIEAKFQELETTMYQQGFSQDWLVQQERAYVEALDHSTDLYKDYNLKLLKTEKSLSEQAAKQRQSEIEKRQKEQQNLISQQVKNFETSLDGMIKAAKTKIDEYNKVIESIKSQISTFASSLSKSYKDMFTFDVDEETGKTTAVKTKNFITNSIKELEQYYDNIQKLRERDVVGESMLNQLTSMSATEGLAVTEYWQSLSDSQLKALDLKWNRYQDLTGKVSASLYSDELEEAETKLDTERNTMLGEIKEAVNTGFSDLLNATGGEMVTVNVNGIQYQSMGDLASAVARELGAQTNRKAAGYAV